MVNKGGTCSQYSTLRTSCSPDLRELSYADTSPKVCSSKLEVAYPDGSSPSTPTLSNGVLR